MDEFPEFRFSQSQAILYEFTKINYPDIYKQIKRRITEGRWEPIGSTWVEPDCNIPNGESFIRQILFGKRFFKQEFGIDSEIIWLPDTFGFNWALPQILKKSGINYFYTSKLTWNDTTVFPFNSFWWQGIDGTKILAHASPVGLEGQIAPKFLIESGKSAEQSAMPPILQTFGYGDGGGGPTKEHLELAIILKTLTGLPSSILSSVREFFKQIEEQSANLPTWNNELYLETHRGTYTTHAWIKKENRLSETLLYTSELLSTIAMIFGKSIALRRYPKNELDQAWKKLLLNQFHDIIPGTAIADVYKDTQDDYQWIKGTCLAIIQNCIQGFSKVNRKSRTEFQFSIFNPLNWARNEYIELFIKSKDKHFSIEDEKGKSIIYQIVKNNKLEQRLLCYVEDIPAFGFKNLIVRAQHGSADSFVPWKTSTHGLESPLFKVHLDCKGTFSSIYAKHHRRELIQKGKRGNIFYTFQDIPKQWEAWNIESDYEKYKIELWKFKHMKFIEHGPLRATIRLEFKSDNGSTISQDVLLYHQLPRIDFQTSVRWLERQTLMKVAFPFNLKRPNATYEIPFGAINRSTKPTIGWDKAKFEVPSQQWADISDTKFGISLLNDSKYGYDAKENTLRLTILRSPHYPHTNEPWCSDEDLIDQGNHTFCYSIYPHNNNWAQGETVRRARELNNPIIVFPNSIVEGIPSILTSSKPNIIVDAIKKAENNDSIIIRIHEAHGIATESAFHLNVNSKDVLECDLLENDLKPIKIKRDKLSLKFRPFEIKTIKINLKPLKKKK
jgi:alpha-mannosidase